MQTDVSFGSWLTKRRKALDLTREDLAHKTGCSVSALRKIESEERRPSRQLAELLAIQLEIPEEERAAFIKIARGERSTDAIKSIPELPELSQVHVQETLVAHAPTPPTPLLGREKEIAALQQMLCDPQYRLITLVGPGGIGKTRVAIEIANLSARDFAQGVSFIPLAGLNSPELILPAITDALGLTFNSSVDPKANLIDHLHKKQALLVIDNMEHLLEGVGLVAEILQSAPRVKFLCTSRESLNLRGEWIFEIGGLQVPEKDDEDNLEDFSATALFLQSINRTLGGRELEIEDRPVAVRICRLVNGMPLAIELAASWGKVLSCSAILEEIKSNIDFLSSTARDMPARHRSLRAVFDHSWDLLSDEEREAFRRLSVLQGSFTREAAREVAGASLDALSALAGKSLVQRAEAGRFQLHELVRQYAASRLCGHPEEVKTLERHSSYFLGLMEKDAQMMHSSSSRGTSPHLTVELPNLRQAWEWANSSKSEALHAAHHWIDLQLRWGTVLEFAGRWKEAEEQYLTGLEKSQKAQDPKMEVRFQWALGRLNRLRSEHEKALEWLGAASLNVQQYNLGLEWCRILTEAGFVHSKRGEFEEAQGLLEKSLEIAREAGDPNSIAWSIYHLGLLAWHRQDLESTKHYCQESLALFRTQDDKLGIAWCLNDLGLVAFRADDMNMARAYFEESLELRREIGEKQGIAMQLSNIGVTAFRLGDHDSARPAFMEGLRLAREIGDRHNMARTLNWLGYLAHFSRRYAEAHGRYSDSLTLYRMMDSRRDMAIPLTNLGHLALDEKDLPRALEAYRDSLPLSMEAGDERNIACILVGLAAVAVNQGRIKDAVVLTSAAEHVREPGKYPWEVIEKRIFEETLKLENRALTKVEFKAAWEKGTKLTLEEAVKLVERL